LVFLLLAYNNIQVNYIYIYIYIYIDIYIYIYTHKIYIILYINVIYKKLVLRKSGGNVQGMFLLY